MTVTVVPACDQSAFQPPLNCCHPVGQPNVRVQLSTGFWPLLVMSTLPTYPLPQSLTSANRTSQVLPGWLAVVKITGGEAHETLPAVSRANTLTV